MQIKKNILKLVIRFLFYGYFTTWSFFAISTLQTENSDKLLRDNEAYLAPSEYNFSISNASEEINSGIYHSDKYLGSSSTGKIGLSANHYNRLSGKPLVPDNKYIYRDYTRPPPVHCPLSL